MGKPLEWVPTIILFFLGEGKTLPRSPSSPPHYQRLQPSIKERGKKRRTNERKDVSCFCSILTTRRFCTTRKGTDGRRKRSQDGRGKKFNSPSSSSSSSFAFFHSLFVPSSPPPSFSSQIPPPSPPPLPFSVFVSIPPSRPPLSPIPFFLFPASPSFSPI